MKKEREVTIYAYKVAKELNLTVPMFYAVFFPKYKYMFENYYKCLPSNMYISTFCKDLHLYTGSSGGHHDFKIGWSTYKEILYRWKIFNNKAKKQILDANKIILEVHPYINKKTMPELRTRLIPYIGMTMNFYADISSVLSFEGIKRKKYQITLANIRDTFDNTEDIYAEHVNITLNNSNMITMFKMKPGDILYFRAKVSKYEYDDSGRVGLTDLYVLDINHSIE